MAAAIERKLLARPRPTGFLTPRPPLLPPSCFHHGLETVTLGFPQGRSDYEPEPGVPLGYAGHGFKRFSRNRDRLGSAGICGACCPICCPSDAKIAIRGRMPDLILAGAGLGPAGARGGLSWAEFIRHQANSDRLRLLHRRRSRPAVDLRVLLHRALVPGGFTSTESPRVLTRPGSRSRQGTSSCGLQDGGSSALPSPRQRRQVQGGLPRDRSLRRRHPDPGYLPGTPEYQIRRWL